MLTYEKRGTPIASVYVDGKVTKVISLYDPEEEKSKKKCCKSKKKCCEKCTGWSCKKKCCSNCCQKEIKEIVEVDDNDFSQDDLNLLDENFFSKMRGNGRKSFVIETEKLKKKIKGGEKIDEDDELYNSAIDHMKKHRNTEIVLHEGEVQVVPRYDTRECCYVFGASGSGKSTWVSKYIHEYKKLFPKNDIFLFSRVDDDKCLDELKPIRIAMDSDVIENPIDPQELHDSLVAFDDTDTLPNKKLREAITDLKDDLLETGRHQTIYVVITSHLATNYKETRTTLNESSILTFFPKSGAKNQINYILKNYCGLDSKAIKKIFDLPSRWVSIRRTYPMCVMYQMGCYII